ncbi:MAG TPA: ABC transporter ATP-binding protein [Gaiellaceae bacterium]
MTTRVAYADTVSGTGASQPLVQVEDLARHFRLGRGHVVRAVDGVSLEIQRGETFGLVGESGSGKSTLARLILRLDTPTSGHIRFADRDLLASSADELRRLRRRMQVVFQDPFTSLNRRKTVEQIISLPLTVHEPQLDRAAKRARVSELLDLVGLRPEHARAYPRQLSGGQCQRVNIARALALGPEFVVLDEAVSAVDVSIQAQILNLLRDLQRQIDLTYLFVTHDLSVVRYMANTIAVMYLGRIVEIGPRDELFGDPQHPYTHALLASIPSVEHRRVHAASNVVQEAPAGESGMIAGCRFHPRCPLGHRDVCRTQDPQLREIAGGHSVACHFPQSAESLVAAAASS